MEFNKYNLITPTTNNERKNFNFIPLVDNNIVDLYIMYFLPSKRKTHKK